MVKPRSITSKSPLFIAGCLPALGIFVFAVCLRIFHIGNQGLWLDEAWSWAVSRMDSPSIWHFFPHNPHPPLYFYLLKWSQAILPANEAGLRIPSAFFSALAIALLMVCAFQLRGLKAAALAGWFAAFSTFDIYYSQETRMYTLLGVLWLLAYVSLLQVIRGRFWFHWVWGFATILMAWTNFYGLLFGLAQVAWAGYLVLRDVWQKKHPSHLFHSVGAIVLVLAFSAPILPLLLNFTDYHPGAAWVPGGRDLMLLYTLITAGLSTARMHFLGGNMLAVVDIPIPWAVIIGTLACGLFAFLGLREAHQKGGKDRDIAILTVWLMLTPIVIFSFLMIFQKQQWALKPFLGIAYLIYTWAGIGLVRQAAITRWLVAGVYLLLSLNTLVPFYTNWQKNPNFQALEALPESMGIPVVILERYYDAPIVFFYRPDLKNVLGITRQPSGQIQMVLIHPDGIAPGDQTHLDCQDPFIQTTSALWYYGDSNNIEQEFKSWPDCLREKPVFVYTNDLWSRVVY